MTAQPAAPRRDAATTRALVTIETAERLAVRALTVLQEIPEHDLAMVPLSVLGAVEEARALLDALTGTTTATTCSLVKDQDWSDEISRGASERIRSTPVRTSQPKEDPTSGSATDDDQRPLQGVATMPDLHTSQPETAQMRRGRTERETCDLNGWDVGTRLVGDEGYGPTVIRLTHFTKDGELLAVTESRQGQSVIEHERFWSLANREWQVATPHGSEPA